ncbi:hypothetical protein P8452_30294 [Trifolium repens]|nr:hypothetical protein P8452_30294 [Trifolium repens]
MINAAVQLCIRDDLGFLKDSDDYDYEEVDVNEERLLPSSKEDSYDEGHSSEGYSSDAHHVDEEDEAGIGEARLSIVSIVT